MNGEDFVLIPAWHGKGKRSEEGLKIDTEVIIENWSVFPLIKGKIQESWKRENFQFFICFCSYDRVFLGALLCKTKELNSKSIKALEDKISEKFISLAPCRSCSLIKVRIGGNRYFSLLYNLYNRSRRNIIFTKEESKKEANFLAEIIAAIFKKQPI